MRRGPALTVWALYVLALGSAQAAGSYSQWVRGGGIDWATVLDCVLTSMGGGALRTLWTLLSTRPTYHVLLECVKDGIMSAMAAVPVLAAITVWRSNWPGSAPNFEMQLLLLVAGGFLGGFVLRSTDRGLKAGLEMGFTWGLSALAKRLGLPPPPPVRPPEPDDPPTVTRRAPPDPDTPPADAAGTTSGGAAP